MTDSCRTCSHAYLRTERTKDYSVECCGLGMHPWVPRMPDDYKCGLHEHATPGPDYPVPAIVWGEVMEIG